jgi:hypothetical protein
VESPKSIGETNGALPMADPAKYGLERSVGPNFKTAAT